MHGPINLRFLDTLDCCSSRLIYDKGFLTFGQFFLWISGCTYGSKQIFQKCIVWVLELDYFHPARGHPSPTTEITVGFYSQILQNGNFHPDGKQCTRYSKKCNLIIQVVNYIKTGIYINRTEHKCTISYEPRKQLSPTENITNDCLDTPYTTGLSSVSTVDRITYVHPC